MYSSASAFRLVGTQTRAAALCLQQQPRGALLSAAFRGLHVSRSVFEAQSTKSTSSKSKKSKDAPESNKKSALKKPDSEKAKLVSQLGKDKLPRKFSSPWMLFNYQHIQELKSKVPAGEKNPPAPELTKSSSAAYKQLSDAEMESLKREWEQKRDEYNEAFEKLVNSMSTEDIKKENAYRAQQRKSGKSNKKNLIDPTKPKAPLNPYMFYYLEQKATGNFSDQHVTNITKLLAEQWADMSDADKKKYEQRSEEDRQRWNKEMSEWKSSKGIA